MLLLVKKLVMILNIGISTKTGNTISSTDKNAPYQGYVLATKEEEAKEDAKKRGRPGEVTDKDIEVNIDAKARDNINQEMDSLELNPHPDDENSFVDNNGNEIFQIGPDGKIGPGGGIGDFKSPEGIPYAEYIDDLNDRLSAAEPQKPETEPKKKKPVQKAKEKPVQLKKGERPNPQQIKDFRTTMFGVKTWKVFRLCRPKATNLLQQVIRLLMLKPERQLLIWVSPLLKVQQEGHRR